MPSLAARERMAAPNRKPKPAAVRAKISASLRGNTNGAMWGKCRAVGEWEPEVLLRHMGEQIRDARVERDVSLSELAAASGISEATLTRIENGKSRRKANRGPRAETIIRIALALGMRPYELMP